MFIITTDGMENASCHYTAHKVKHMVKHEEEKYGWEFIFLGANIDAIGAAENIGIRRERAVNYNCDSEGTRLNYEVLSCAISQMRCAPDAPLDANWKDRIDDDYQKRGRKQ